MRGLRRTCLVIFVIGSFISLIQSRSVPKVRKNNEGYESETEDREDHQGFDDFEDEESQNLQQDAHVEMLPGDFENLDDPGVDHLELRERDLRNVKEKELELQKRRDILDDDIYFESRED
ncbi:hypothetical protein QAD02_009569 [Eretmocerus hayati]|uniref:Uncharacterized protein n=1 Tax=Eretmocerus hayati TaxID=131215 RepID=A0ACC2NAG5_9HYME|nr:hypothetical protein QAD02_009569 [Eretmocerus hayati]